MRLEKKKDSNGFITKQNFRSLYDTISIASTLSVHGTVCQIADFFSFSLSGFLIPYLSLQPRAFSSCAPFVGCLGHQSVHRKQYRSIGFRSNQVARPLYDIVVLSTFKFKFTQSYKIKHFV